MQYFSLMDYFGAEYIKPGLQLLTYLSLCNPGLPCYPNLLNVTDLQIVVDSWGQSEGDHFPTLINE